jgi:DNA-directed RNA polymerase subunit RPC12/RpoP
MASGPDYSSDGTTLVEVLNEFEAKGYTGQFIARPGGKVKCVQCGAEVDATAVELHALQRVEGASDPDDMAAVGALVCPDCGARGTIVLHYGPAASEEEDDVLRLLEDDRPR